VTGYIPSLIFANRHSTQELVTRRRKSSLVAENSGTVMRVAEDPWTAQVEALGAYIRYQRQLANLSLRQLAQLTTLSNPYLSQVERGLHQPSVRVLKLIADGLGVSAESLLAKAGLADRDDGDEPPEAEAAIRADPRLSDDQKAALIAVYRSMVEAHAPEA